MREARASKRSRRHIHLGVLGGVRVIMQGATNATGVCISTAGTSIGMVKGQVDFTSS
jgi:hypothetical protein